MSDPNKAIPVLQSLRTAMGYYESGQLLVAEGLCRQVLAHDPRNADSLNMLGAIAAQGGRYSEAAELFSKATHVKKNAPLFFYNLGLARHYRRPETIEPAQ